MESGYYENLKDQINKDGIQVYNIYTQPLFRIIHGKYYDFYMSSVNDDQIILTIPFKTSVNLFSILLDCEFGDTCPKRIKLYKNQKYISFTDIESKIPTSVLDITEKSVSKNKSILIEQQLWRNTSSITLFIESSYGGKQTIIQNMSFFGKVN